MLRQGRHPQVTVAIPPVLTVGQRLETWAINFVLPGLGSFLIMNDTIGGVIQLVSAGLGWDLIALSYHHIAPFEFAGAAFGQLLVPTQIVSNIVRSATYTRYDKISPVISPELLNISFIPRRNWIERVSFSYTIQFRRKPL